MVTQKDLLLLKIIVNDIGLMWYPRLSHYPVDPVSGMWMDIVFVHLDLGFWGPFWESIVSNATLLWSVDVTFSRLVLLLLCRFSVQGPQTTLPTSSSPSLSSPPTLLHLLQGATVTC